MQWQLGLKAVDWLRARVIDLVYPPHCAWCALPCSLGARFCHSCQEQLIDRSAFCDQCAATLAAAGTRPLCPHCQAKRPPFAASVRLGQYDGRLRQAVLQLKRSKDPSLGMALAHLLVEQRGERLRALGADVVVPMPMHWTRRFWRGVNSPVVVGQTLAHDLRLPFAPHLLRMRRRTRPQTGLTRNKRLANVRGAFLAAAHCDLDGSRVLLVDDVMTTGATASEAARALRKAGAAEVVVAVLARAQGLG